MHNIISIIKKKMRKLEDELDPGLWLTLLFSFVYFLVVFHSCLFRYNTLQYHDWDFSLYANGMWNIIHGNPYISISNKPFLGNHFNIIAFIIAPVFSIFRSPLTLLFLQSLSLSLVTVPIYLLARRKFDWRASAGFALIYLLYPSLVYVAMYEFHFEAFAPLFLALAFYFLITNRKLWLFVTAILAMFCKENVPAVVFAMGLYAVLFRPRRRLVGLALALVGLACFLLVTLKLQPYFIPGNGIGYAGHYAKYGEGFGNVYIYMLTHPVDIIRDLLSTPLKRQFFSRTLSPLLFLPLLRPDILLITAPTVLKNLLSKVPTTHQIYWQYTATIIPFMIISTMYGLEKLSKLHLIKKLLLFILGGIIITEIILSVRFYQESPFFVKYHRRMTPVDMARKSVLQLIPKTAPVMATFDFLPNLSMRKGLYAFYCAWRGGYYTEFPVIDYALVDFNDYFIRKDVNFKAAKISKLFTGFLVGKDWNVKYARGDIVLFEKTPTPHNRIVTLIDASEFKAPGEGLMLIDNALELVDYTVESPEKDTLHITFYWRAKRPVNSLYDMYFFMADGKLDRMFHSHALAYWFFIPGLKKDKILKEEYWLMLPDKMGPHVYAFSAGFVNLSQRRRANIKVFDKDIADSHNKLILGNYDNR